MARHDSLHVGERSLALSDPAGPRDADRRDRGVRAQAFRLCAVCREKMKMPLAPVPRPRAPWCVERGAVATGGCGRTGDSSCVLAPQTIITAITKKSSIIAARIHVGDHTSRDATGS